MPIGPVIITMVFLLLLRQVVKAIVRANADAMDASTLRTPVGADRDQ
jgi:hypothetical protein